MNDQAFLMVLLRVLKTGKIKVDGVTITSSEHLTCNLQKEAYACIDKTSGNSYQEARNKLVESVKQRANFSQSGSLWHVIYSQIKDRE
jgi:hypothetical protein